MTPPPTCTIGTVATCTSPPTKWNRSGPLDAGSATLSIEDGTATTRLPLSASQIRSGNLVYVQHTAHITARLQFDGPDIRLRPKVAVALSMGRGVTANESEAFGWYRRAAAKNNADAQFIVGQTYAEGRPWVTKNTRFALTSLRLAAARDHREAKELVKKLEK